MTIRTQQTMPWTEIPSISLHLQLHTDWRRYAFITCRQVHHIKAVQKIKETGMHRIGGILLGGIIAMLTLTCARITVNDYFPAAELEDAAAQIEQEIRSDTPDGGASHAPSPAPSSDSAPPPPAESKHRNRKVPCSGHGGVTCTSRSAPP